MDKEKVYKVTTLARRLGVHRQTVNYWIKKGWITPRRDYRNYPVFTESDLRLIKEWRNTIKGAKVINIR